MIMMPLTDSNTSGSISGQDKLSGGFLYIITVFYNSRGCISPFLQCLADQDFHEWNLVVIDNASTDGTPNLLDTVVDSRITTVRNLTNLGFSKAVNQALRMAFRQGGELMIIINNDVWFPPDFLSQLITAHRELQADVIVPRIMRLDRPNEAWYAGGHLDYGWVFKNVHEPYNPENSSRVRTVEFASGCCLGLSRRVLTTVGLFDESFFVYWEDTDYCIRLKDHGFPIYYFSDIVMMHEGGHASGGELSATFNKLFWCSYVKILRKHFGLFVTIRTMLRISAKELGRPNRRASQIAVMMMAMVRGLATRLAPPAEI